VSRETPPAFPLEEDLEKDRRVGGAACEPLVPFGLCLRIDASFVTAAVSLSFELPPTESFRSFSAPEAFRPVGGPDDMGPGLGATDDEAVDADGGLELRSRFTGDLVRVAGRAEEPLEDLPVDEGTRFSADADFRVWGLEALDGFPEDTAPRLGGASSFAESLSSKGGVLFSVPVCCVDSDAATTLVILDFEDGAC